MSFDAEEALRQLAKTLKPRDPYAHKGTYGTLTVVAGSRFYRGAATLAVSAALRTGAGIVRLASVEEAVTATAASVPEAIYLPLTASEEGGIDYQDLVKQYRRIAASQALLVGCGMTDTRDTGAIVEHLLRYADMPLILDADGLNALKRTPELLKEAKHPPVITPHVGEMARLSGRTVEEIRAGRSGVALTFAKKYGCVTVLKDYETAVASPEGEVFLCHAPCGGLARGGSGDVLAGITASLVCQGYDGFTAATCAVLFHRLAADEAASIRTEEAMLPSDLVAVLPAVFRKIATERNPQ